MGSALHPTLTKSITVVDYLNEFGAKLDGNGNLRTRPLARCPACGGEMYTKGEANPAVNGVFSHQPKVNHFCPLKSSAEKSYIILPPVDENPSRAKALRSSFMSNWKFHYALMKSYLKVLSVFDFIKLIRFADQNRIWSYRHIEEVQVPYIFLALKEFPPVKAKGKYLRRDWVRFWFDSRVRGLDDLWIETDGDWLLIKASYSSPRNGSVPTYKQLKETEMVQVDFGFLNFSEPELASFVIQEMKKEFGA